MSINASVYKWSHSTFIFTIQNNDFAKCVASEASHGGGAGGLAKVRLLANFKCF